jgi:hypothetical protein
MHCIPLESFPAKPQYDIFALQELGRIKPMYWRGLSSWTQRINFEGIIYIAAESAFTQVYRNGVIEAVRVNIPKGSHDPTIIPSLLYEEALVEYLPTCLEILKDLGCSPPVFVGISLIGVRRLRLAVDPRSMPRSVPIDRDVLMLPEIVVEDLSARVGRF